MSTRDRIGEDYGGALSEPNGFTDRYRFLADVGEPNGRWPTARHNDFHALAHLALAATHLALAMIMAAQGHEAAHAAGLGVIGLIYAGLSRLAPHA